jgi:hypothetical protein
MPRRFALNEHLIWNKNGLGDYGANKRDYYNYPTPLHGKLSLLKAMLETIFSTLRALMIPLVWSLPPPRLQPRTRRQSWHSG